MTKLGIRLSLIMLTFSSILFTNCSDDEGNDSGLEIPETYAFLRNGVSSVSFSGQTTRIAMAEEIVTGLKVSTDNFSEDQLLAMYGHEEGAEDFDDADLNASDKSCKSKTAASNDYFSSNTTTATAIRTEFDGFISDQVNEIFPNAETLATAGVAGQIADGTSVRYVNAGGLEYDQMFTKSLIGALMVDQALNNYLSTSVLDDGTNTEDNDADVLVDGTNYTSMEHKWDEAYGYLYGASQDTSNPNATLGDDSFLNKYIGRVEGDEDFAGIADEIFQAFVTGRAAIVAKDYEARDEQADIIREAVSEVIGIRAVYYLQQGKNGLNPDDMGPAFHDLSEGLGFIYSLQFTREPGADAPYLSRTEVQEIIDELTTGDGFWDVTEETLDDISEQIAAEFDFTVAQAAE